MDQRSWSRPTNQFLVWSILHRITFPPPHQLCSSKCHSIYVWFHSYSLSIIGDGRGSSSVKIKWQFSIVMHLSLTITVINIHELPPVLSIIIVDDFSGRIFIESNCSSMSSVSRKDIGAININNAALPARRRSLSQYRTTFSVWLK